MEHIYMETSPVRCTANIRPVTFRIFRQAQTGPVVEPVSCLLFEQRENQADWSRNERGMNMDCTGVQGLEYRVISREFDIAKKATVAALGKMDIQL